MKQDLLYIEADGGLFRGFGRLWPVLAWRPDNGAVIAGAVVAALRGKAITLPATETIERAGKRPGCTPTGSQI